ncbi:uncharacterized protein [Typha latifolia]|uniref:uncharacterized protein n=1 Tax=Typha latifolia TaxID=4733 RepID=UPI003C306B91
MMKRTSQIPAFGHWDYCDELPMTQYFESAIQAGLFHRHYLGEDGDLFKVKPPTYRHLHGSQNKVRNGGVEKQQRKQGSVCDVGVGRSPRKVRAVPKAVDEDLYKIPPELLYQKPKTKRLLRKLWSGCLGINCIG